MPSEPLRGLAAASAVLSWATVALLVAMMVLAWPNSTATAERLGSTSPGSTPSVPAPTPPESASPTRPAPSTATPSTTPTPNAKGKQGQRGAALLEVVRVIGSRPNRPGYDRSCSPGAGCVFGTDWNDATSAPGSRNGCDTRNDVLRQALRDIEIDPGTNGCVVRRGVLDDPYTGRTINFERGWGSSLAVQVDHVIPLAAAWDLGAAVWPQPRREAFANDIRFELMAVDGDTNMSKSDGTPGEWMPPNRAYHCGYAVKYLEASVHWKLPVTRADHAVLSAAVSRCQ
jgi:hypothetical protein